MTGSAVRWAKSTFGSAKLGDARRTKRLVQLMGQVASTPGGRISRVFTHGASRQAAYDFVEHEGVRPDLLLEALSLACVRACRDLPRALVVLDGTSLGLTDRAESKGFGSVGARSRGGHGLKVMNTLAMTESGVPLGIPAQEYWVRGARVKRGYRRRDERESIHWRRAAEAVEQRFTRCAPDTRLHFIADREADATLLIRHLAQQGHDFTIRAQGTRNVTRGRRRVNVRKALGRMPENGRVLLCAPGRGGAAQRMALLSVRVAKEILVLRDHHIGERRAMELIVVQAREVGRPPKGHDRLEWLLYTTTAVCSLQGAVQVLERYALRWRIEEMHRTWKSGACNVEQMQLRSVPAAVKWACMLASVAARIERLKQLSREQPDQPASVVLTDDEIETLRLLKRQNAKRTETISDEMPTLEQAVGWIAELGGYIRGRSPPGSAVIARGMERLDWSAKVFLAIQQRSKAKR
jgi:Transposase DNA-binding/Transposase DDE domain